MGTRSKRKRKARPTTDQQPTAPPSRRRKAERTDGWAALPSHILREILIRVPQADVLRGAGFACAPWRRAAAHDPLLWRRIDLADDEIPDAPTGWRAMARAAVDRSAGRCESFRGPVDGDFLHYLADRSPALRSLHVARWFFGRRDEELFTGVAKKLPLLEQRVLSAGLCGRGQLSALLDHCPRLQLLDAAGCYTIDAIGIRFLAGCESRIKELRMPRWFVGSCSCCTRYAQKYADKHHA